MSRGVVKSPSFVSAEFDVVCMMSRGVDTSPSFVSTGSAVVCLMSRGVVKSPSFVSAEFNVVCLMSRGVDTSPSFVTAESAVEKSMSSYSSSYCSSYGWDLVTDVVFLTIVCLSSGADKWSFLTRVSCFRATRVEGGGGRVTSSSDRA